MKTRSGFSVESASAGPALAAEGIDYTVEVRLGPLVITEPVRVVSLVHTNVRCGFAYGTRRGHPVSGEEAFIVHRDEHGQVFLTIRSVTRASRDLPWRVLFPVLLAAQPWYRRHHFRSLLDHRSAVDD